MAYHINLKGEVGVCTAKIQCRFGDFERDHYTTEEQARAAYEALQAGKSMAVHRRADSFFASRAKEVEEKDEELERKKKFVASLKPLESVVPPRPDNGYWLEIDRNVQLKRGTALTDGSTIIDRVKESDMTFVETDFGWFTVKSSERANGRWWIEDRPLPEALIAYDDAVANRRMEDGFKNFTRPKIKWSRMGAEEAFVKTRNAYKELLEKNLKAGVNQPYLRAYFEQFGSLTGWTNQPGEVAFRWALCGGAERFKTEGLRVTIEALTARNSGWPSRGADLAAIVKASTRGELHPGVDIAWEEIDELRNA